MTQAGRRHPMEFIEHYSYKKKYLTDIWLDPNTGKYSSVVSNLDAVTFDSVEELKQHLNTKMEVWSNGK